MMGLLLCLAPLFTMADPEAMVNPFGLYPGYDGTPASGSVYLTTLNGTWINFELDLGNLPAEQNFTIHIHSGVSCDTHAQVGGHLWAPFTGPDPWNAAFFTADDQGERIASWEIDFGYSVAQTIGHAVVIHNATGARVFCGIITSTDASSEGSVDYETAVMSKYPTYAGNLNVNGVVEVWETTAKTLIVNFRLSNLTASTSGGIHIHVGKTCATSGLHYYASDPDPWNTTYTSNSAGLAEGLVEVDSGYGLSDNIAHAIVIHDAAGNRIACGTLGGVLVGSVRDVVRYPGYNGTLTVNASVDILVLDDSESGLYTFVVDIKNGEANAAMKFHIHSGLSCDSPATIGGHFWAPFDALDDWLVPLINTDGDGDAQYQFDLDFGYSAEHFVGHAVVIHAASGTAVACGVIKKDTAANGIVYKEAVMNKYPLYNGSYVVTGDVQVWDLDAKRQVVNFRLRGLPASTTGGLHIHAGTNCSADGGHFWTPMTAPDPWNVSLGTFYTSNANGTADGSFIVESGYLLSANKHHAVVVHDGQNVKLACGLLGGVAPPAGTNASCPSAAIQASFTACKIYDFTGPTCSAACGAALQALVAAFAAQNATIPEALACLDAAPPASTNGNLVALKERIHPEGSGLEHEIPASLCNVTGSVSGAVALSGLFVACSVPFLL